MSDVKAPAADVKERERKNCDQQTLIDHIHRLKTTPSLQKTVEQVLQSEALSAFRAPNLVSPPPPGKEESHQERQHRLSGKLVWFFRPKETRPIREWEQLLFKPEFLIQKPLEALFKQNDAKLDPKNLQNVPYKLVLSALESDEGQKWDDQEFLQLLPMSDLEWRNVDLTMIELRSDTSPLESWIRTFFGDERPLRCLPTDLPKSADLTLAQFLQLYEDMLLQRVGNGWEVRPLSPNKLIFVPSELNIVKNTQWVFLVRPSADQERLVISRDFQQSSEMWSSLFETPHLPHSRRMSIETFLTEIKEMKYSFPLRWQVQTITDHLVVLKRTPQFFQQQCINASSYISGDDWTGTEKDMLLFYLPKTSDWKQLQQEGGHCVLASHVFSAIDPEKPVRLESHVALWKGGSNGSPIPTIRFVKLPTPFIWVDQHAVAVLYEEKGRLESESRVHAFLCIPMGKVELGTADAKQGIMSSLHGAVETIYTLLPLDRRWTVHPWWPAVYQWTVDHGSTLFGISSLVHFFRNIYLPGRICDFDELVVHVNHAHRSKALWSTLYTAILNTLNEGSSRFPWKRTPSEEDIVHVIGEWHAYAKSSRKIVEALGAIRVQEEYIKKLAKSLDKYTRKCQDETITQYYTGWVIENDTIQELGGKYLYPLTKRTGGGRSTQTSPLPPGILSSRLLRSYHES